MRGSSNRIWTFVYGFKGTNKLKVILLGPPGAGKGTQAARIAEVLKVTRAASGDLFRENLSKGTELGRLAQIYMNRGILVPDDVTIGMVHTWINAKEQAGGFVLDGFPRNLIQAKALDEELESKGGLDRALYINVSKEELVRRLSGRLTCRNCQTPYHISISPPMEEGECDRCGGEVYQRADDKPEVVGTRIQVFLNETSPLVDCYRKAGRLAEVNGEGTIEEVGDALIAEVT